MISTRDGASLGIPQLDALLAPLPKGATILVTHDPGLEAEAFLYQAAHRQMTSGRTVVYLVTNRSPSSVRESMKIFGFDPAEAADRLVFIDAYSPLMGADEGEKYTVQEPGDVRKVAGAIEKAAGDLGDAVFVLDGLSTLMDQASPQVLGGQLPRILKALRRFRFSITLFTRWPYAEGVDDLLSRYDGLVRLKAVEDRVTFGQYFSLERASWLRGHDSTPRLYRILRPGGVFVYIPKIVVTGPYHAGKSTFIHSVAQTAVSGEGLGTTVALDHGHAVIEGIVADIFGTPGQVRFDPLLETIANQALGVVVLVDSTQPDTFPRAKEMMQKTWKQGLPAIVAANKQDLSNALAPAEVARRMEIDARTSVVGCVSQDPGSARQVLLRLMDQILGGVEAQ